MKKSTPNDKSVDNSGNAYSAGPDVFRMRLKTAMMKKGWTQSDLAKAAGTSVDTISRIMTGKHNFPHPTTVKNIASVLEVTVEWLMGEDTQTASAGSAADFIPVIGTAEAGAFRAPEVQNEDQDYPQISAARHDRFRALDHFAYNVAGDSVDQIGISHGDTVICVGWANSGLRPVTGLIVVIERSIHDGLLQERSIRQMEVIDDMVIFHARSSNKNHKPIEISRTDLDAGNGVNIKALVVNVIKNMFKI